MIQEGLRVAVPLKDKTLGVVAVDVKLVGNDPAVFVQLCRLSMKLIQIGAKGDVQPFETG